MKHLISLSLKYIRRQKLRSVLTFLCITLSVFILNTASVYFSSIHQTAINAEIAAEGSWEAELSKLLADSPKENAYDIIRNHVTIEDTFYYGSEFAHGNKTRNEGGIRYFQIALDGTDAIRTFDLTHFVYEGNSVLQYGTYQYVKTTENMYQVSGHNYAYVPEWFQDYGYQVGDTVEVSISQVRASLSDTSEQVKAARALVDELNDNFDNYFILDEPNAENNTGYPLLSYMLEQNRFEDIIFANPKSGKPYSFIIHIAGFAENPSMIGNMLPVSGSTVMPSLYLYTAYDNDICFDNIAYLPEDAYDSYSYLYTTFKDNVDFDDALRLLFSDLGFDSIQETDYLSGELNPNMYHMMLLGLKLKGADAITTLFRYIAFLLILIVLLWFVARFVIDNAFEISVQERSSQFAVLRIMGASQAQLMALVFTEAIVYCLTAIPLGMAMAFGSCYYVMHRFQHIGLDFVAFDANPVVTIIGLFMSIIAIFISAYTSAIWAARKLSPLEALQYGKPHKKSKKTRKQKTKPKRLNRKAQSFILHYTLKNMLRTKQRFLVASISMILGIMLFIISSLSGITFRHVFDMEMADDPFMDDFSIYVNGMYPDIAERAEEMCKDNDAISLSYSLTYFLPTTAGSSKLLYAMLPDISSKKADLYGGYSKISGYLVTRTSYEEVIAPVAGMSYDEFVASGAAMVFSDPYGNDMEEGYQRDENNKLIRVNEDGWYPLSALGMQNASITVLLHDPIPLLGVICVDTNQFMIGSHSILLPADTELLPEHMKMHHMWLHFQVNDSSRYEEARQLILDFSDSLSEPHQLNDQYMEQSGTVEAVRTVFTAALILLLCIWLVGVLSMVNSINTSVLNRQNELIMMRAVGMTKKQLMGTIVQESLLFSGISTGIGLVLGTGSYLIAMPELIYDSDIWKNTLHSLTPILIIIVLLTFLLNMVIAVAAAIPGLQSLSKRLKKV